VFYLALLVGIPSTLYQSPAHTPKILPCEEVQAEVSRPDEGLDECKSL